MRYAPLMIDPDNPDVREVLSNRDVSGIFRLLLDGGMSQRDIAELVKMSQSEVSEILKGRRVQAYDVLVRVADGIGIPRGQMGLAYTEDSEEVDEDVERRKLMAIAGMILFGAPVFGEPAALIVRRALIQSPERVSGSDVSMYEQTVARLEVLDREAGGMAAREALVGTAVAGERMLKAKMAVDSHTRLRYAVGEAHRLAGWASGDVGLMDHCRWHMHKALDLVAGDGVRVTQILATSGSMEKGGDPNHALKMFQVAGMAESPDPQIGGVLAGLSVSAYQNLGHPDQANTHLRKAKSMFRDADHTQSLPFFAFYGNGAGLLAAAEMKLGNYTGARANVLSALQNRPSFDVRCNALDTIVLATISIEAGEFRDGIEQSKRALMLVREVGSRRVRERLAPLEQALAARRDSTCQDLARTARQFRVVV